MLPRLQSPLGAIRLYLQDEVGSLKSEIFRNIISSIACPPVTILSTPYGSSSGVHLSCNTCQTKFVLTIANLLRKIYLPPKRVKARLCSSLLLMKSSMYLEPIVFRCKAIACCASSGVAKAMYPSPVARPSPLYVRTTVSAMTLCPEKNFTMSSFAELKGKPRIRRNPVCSPTWIPPPVLRTGAPAAPLPAPPPLPACMPGPFPLEPSIGGGLFRP
jgi:hypothetical protein